jgi:acyl-CoA thioesterase I
MYKRTFIISSILIVVGIFWFLNRDSHIKNYPSSGEGIVAFGDSLVQGVGSLETEGFIQLLENELSLSIKNYGKSGDTTRSAISRLTDVFEENPSPQVAIILLGGNDYLTRVPIEETFENIRFIVHSFQERGAIVLLLGVRGGILKDRFDDEFERIAKETGSAYVPNVLDGILGNKNLMSDPIHPNTEGYAVIARKVRPSLIDIIK